MKLSPKVWAPFAILGGGALVVAILFWMRPSVESRPPQAPPRLVRAARVSPEDVRFVVRAHGNVVPRTESDLVPQVAGEVVWVSPSLVSGGFFSKGEPLVRIDRSDYESERESARAAVARSESELDLAKKERGRQRRLRESAVASQARIDDAENAFRVAEAALREARARLQRADQDLERTELKAPYDGRVRSESVDAGQFVSRGEAIATLYATDYAEVRLPLPDRELAYLDLPLSYQESEGEDGVLDGDAPRVLLSAEFAGSERTWEGRVVRTEGEIDPQTRMVHVVARVDDPYDRAGRHEGPPLAVGLFVEARILGRSAENAFVLPRQALRDGDQVLLVDDDNRLRFRKVTVLRSEEDRVVIGEGLAAGDRVCLSPIPAPVEGMVVRVAEEAAGALPASAPAADGPEPDLARAAP